MEAYYRYVTGVKDWLSDVAKMMNVAFEIAEWKAVYTPKVPKQDDNTSCGVFALAFADLLSSDLPLDNFSQKDVDQFRKKICLDILNIIP